MLDMKSLFRMRDPRKPYHEAAGALPLMQALDIRTIRDRAPIPLISIDEALFGNEGSVPTGDGLM